MTAYMIAILIYIDQAQYFFFSFGWGGTKEKGPKHKKQETTKSIKEEARVNQVGCPGVGPDGLIKSGVLPGIAVACMHHMLLKVR